MAEARRPDSTIFDWPLRIGHGYDLHRLEPRSPLGRGQRLLIGGIEFQHTRGPVGHSDADALLHAITDALLGALAEPDIGQLFSDSDPAHKARDSADFLAEAHRRVTGAGWSIANIDATVILQDPRIGPRKDEIRANIADILCMDIGRINVKGKSHEHVDAVGQGRAIEAHAVALLVRAPGG